MVFRVVARVLLLHAVTRMLLRNIWRLLGYCYGVQGAWVWLWYVSRLFLVVDIVFLGYSIFCSC